MKATLVVAAREVAERKLILLGALLLGLLPLALSGVTGPGGSSVAEVRLVSAGLLSLTIALTLSIAFGATILVSDITQKRMAFYLSRPLSSVSIWGGKLLAAWLVSVLGTCLAALPTVLLEGVRSFEVQGSSARAALYVLVSIALLLAGAHVISSIVKLRSAWAVPDFLLAVFFTIAIFLPLHGLTFVGFWDIEAMSYPPDWFAWWVAAPLIVVFIVASYVQVTDGRIDPRRSHGALSATLWGIMALIAVPLAGLSWWVNAATPEDLVSIFEMQAAPRGAWVRLYGHLRARGSATSSFLYDADSGRFMKNPSWWPRFSADGRRVAWAEAHPGFFERKSTIRVLALDSTKPTTFDSNIEMKRGAQLAFSPSGRRLAVSDGKILAAYEVSDPSNPKQILALLAEAGGRTVLFLDEDRIRLFPQDLRGAGQGIAPTDIEIEEISLPTKKSLVTGRLEPGSFTYVRLSADGRYLVETRGKLLTLHDSRTGALLATLSEDLESPKLRFLSGDRIVVAGVANGKAILKIFLEGGRAPALPLDLGLAASVVLGGEVAPGRIAVSLSPFQSNDDRSRRAWKLAIVDMATGLVSPGPDGLVPADRFAWWFSPVLPPAEAGSPASKLFLNASGALVRLDPGTGAQTVLLGRSK